MNPKGIKPTITSHFKKPTQEIDFVNHDMWLFRSFKPVERDVATFRTSTFMSKPEIKQYLTKIYDLPVENVGIYRKSGKVKRNYVNNQRWRKPDWKKAYVKLDFDVDPNL